MDDLDSLETMGLGQEVSFFCLLLLLYMKLNKDRIPDKPQVMNQHSPESLSSIKVSGYPSP